MGHASMQVTLGYLRNLEVPVLRVDDMPNHIISWRIIEMVMRVTLFVAALIFVTPVQATRDPVDLFSSDSLEIKISQNDSLYKKVLKLHWRADELNKMVVLDIELAAILVAELARTQQMKNKILGDLDLSFSEFAAKVSPRLANGSLSAERALLRQNKKIENRLRRASKQRIHLLSSRGANKLRIHLLNIRLRRMCEADYMLEWYACVSPYHDFKSNQTTITLTASNALMDSAIEQMRLKSKRTKPLVIGGAVTLLTLVVTPLVVIAVWLSGV
jgi:hypothetical protein